MEIMSVQHLNLEDLSHLYTLLQDMDYEGDDITLPSTSPAAITSGGNLKKRSRGGRGYENQKMAARDSQTSFLMLEEDEKEGTQNWEFDCGIEKYHQLDTNQWQIMHTTEGYITSMNDTYETDKSRTKRSRRSGSMASGTENVSSSGPSSGRRLWVKDRSKDWWEKCNSPDFPDEEFKKGFRMSKSTFNMICEELDSVITKKNTMLREAIPVRQRVAVCIWRLATGEPLRLVSKKFGLGISTCHKLVLEVCSAIKTVLMPKFLQWPDEEGMRTTKAEYSAICGISDVGGSMYTTHIPIIAPKISVATYFNKRHTERNQKTSYSITVQGVVDHNGVFTDICIGWPGSMPDEQVLEKSALHQRASRGLLKDVWIVGTSGHALSDWVLVPYSHQNLTWTQHAFNEKISDLQSIAKDAFMRLKARWSCLQKRTEVKLQDLPVVLGACCVLHNICEFRNETMDPELKFELFDDPMVPENNWTSVSAVQTRDHIAHNLLHRGLGGNSFI